jgi:hypothetical protein
MYSSQKHGKNQVDLHWGVFLTSVTPIDRTPASVTFPYC